MGLIFENKKGGKLFVKMMWIKKIELKVVIVDLKFDDLLGMLSFLEEGGRIVFGLVL